MRPSSPDINLDPVYFSFFNIYIDLNYHHFIDKCFSSITVHVDYVQLLSLTAMTISSVETRGEAGILRKRIHQNSLSLSLISVTDNLFYNN